MVKAKAATPVLATSSAPKPPKKLIPRTAPTPAVPLASKSDAPDVAKPELEPKPATTAAPKVRAARKPSREDEVVARHQKVLAEALVEAQAINYAQPLVMRQDVIKEKKKPAKSKKIKLVRDCFAMPELEYARVAEIKKRLAGMGRETRKSEVLRGGIALLAALNDSELKAVMARIERIKTGRPAK